MGKGRRTRTARVAGRGQNDTIPVLESEYPSLGEAEIAEGAAKRLGKSRRKFFGENRAAPSSHAFDARSVGEFGDFAHGSTSEINKWLQGWQMPDSSLGKPDVETSAAVFVGLIDSLSMPEVSALHPGPPFILLTSHFLDMCRRVTELYTVAGVLLSPSADRDVAVVDASRQLVFEYIDPSLTPSCNSTEIIAGTRIPLFTIRTTSAAARWAIAHEMAHAVASEKDRSEAYERSTAL